MSAQKPPLTATESFDTPSAVQATVSVWNTGLDRLGPITGNYLFDVANGRIPGHRLVKIPGRHDTNVETTQLGDLSLIPGVVILPVPAGIQLQVVSSNAADGVAGAGVLTLDIHYLDDTTGFEKCETLTMNGTTPVNTTETNFGPIQWIHAKTLGTVGGAAVGNISLTDTAGSVTYEYIKAGGNQSLTSRYTISTGKTGYFVDWHASGLKKRIEFYLRATCERFDRTLTPGVFLFQDAVTAEASNSGSLPGGYVKFPALCQVKISAQAESIGGEAGGGFTLMLVDDGF